MAMCCRSEVDTGSLARTVRVIADGLARHIYGVPNVVSGVCVWCT